ncbi:hypothetical protein COT48_06335 [Candidatus Woesearchaeota archaeon CG08_land_8_20_14_0_20_47_9]|nr:MAG: hypothetical protein AUJ69_03355 [Candidatus Woesearchaeota archaeon CG1_02_47_18]PIO03070.1 MAG: hypothetical protein COT48_06335 [Candidatus Woesearchaeota archaeon CG08_land_8_20_14_0_20_47_9]HII29724.1 radical SAM protein [Candidatus Woesearchaeota archaeon]
MKRILLVDPSLTRPRDMDARKCRIGVVPPLGLAYIAAVMEEQGYEVRIVDCIAEGFNEEPEYLDEGVKYGLSDNALKRIIAEFSPDVVGVSCLFSNKALDAYNVCRLVKEFNPGIPTIIGGIHPTVRADETIRQKNVDFVILGEGEYSFRDLVKALERGADFSDIDGIAYKKDGRVVINPKTRFIENLDELPFPARHLLKMDIYSSAQSPHSNDLRQIPYTTVLSSRGCPANCTFCCLKHVEGRRWRARSAENVIREVRQLVDQYGVREIHFEDDNLTVDKERALKIFDGLKKIGVSWNVPSGSAVFSLDEEIIERMKDSGAHTISLAIESGSQDVLRRLMHKPVNLSRVKPLVEKAKQVGLKVKGFFIIGYPGETRENIKETVEFARSLRLDWTHFFIAFPHYGTELRALCEEKGYLKEDKFDNRKSFYLGCIETPEFTPEYLKELADEANLDMNFKNNPNLVDGNYDRAIGDFKSVIKLYPHLDFAHFYLGVAYEKKGELENAKREWQHVLKLNPGYEEASAKLNQMPVRKLPEEAVCLKRRIFVDKGRTAFSHILRLIPANNRILLPAYIGINDKEGSGVFDPIRELGMKYAFYNINKDLSIDMKDFIAKVKDPSINSVLVIHYFGFVQGDIEEIASICRKHHKYLVEDCAHALMSTYSGKKLGSFGDASFFSLHKSLPIKEGGILQINNPEIKDPDIEDSEHIKLFPKFDLEEIARIRRENYLYMLDKLKCAGIEILYPQLPDWIVPLNFPILIKNKDRDKVYFEMLDRGIELISLYYRLIEQIGKGYESSYYISKRITNLPIHQDVTRLDIDRMVRGLKEIVGRGMKRKGAQNGRIPAEDNEP